MLGLQGAANGAQSIYCSIPLLQHCPTHEKKEKDIVAGLWTSIQNGLKPLNIYFEFTPLNIIFGVLEENGPEIINTIILLGKIFIEDSIKNEFESKLYFF